MWVRILESGSKVSGFGFTTERAEGLEGFRGIVGFRTWDCLEFRVRGSRIRGLGFRGRFGLWLSTGALISVTARGSFSSSFQGPGICREFYIMSGLYILQSVT